VKVQGSDAIPCWNSITTLMRETFTRGPVNSRPVYPTESRPVAAIAHQQNASLASCRPRRIFLRVSTRQVSHFVTYIVFCCSILENFCSSSRNGREPSKAYSHAREAVGYRRSLPLSPSVPPQLHPRGYATFLTLGLSTTTLDSSSRLKQDLDWVCG
jgi:hypothetical protein